MKRILAIALIAVMLLGLCACSINKAEVSILWSGEHDAAVTPNSLINAMDRAMYIENISYKHYAAKGDQATQTKQAEAALNSGCAALMVELVDVTAAQTIVDMAKAKNVPVIFFGCDVDASVVASYDKCACVITDEATLAKTYADMVNEYLEENETSKLDKNGDGKITCLMLGKLTVENELLIPVTGTVEELKVDISTEEKTTLLFFKSTEEKGTLVNAAGQTIELILADDDQQTLETLLQLQAKGFNSDKLTTHFVPVFTVGADADYKAYVLQNQPTDTAARAAYLEDNKYFVDMTGIDAEEWNKKANGEPNEVDTMIFITLDQVGTGRLCGSVIEDYDAVAVAAAKLAATFIKNKTPEASVVSVPYTVTVAG